MPIKCFHLQSSLNKNFKKNCFKLKGIYSCIYLLYYYYTILVSMQIFTLHIHLNKNVQSSSSFKYVSNLLEHLKSCPQLN